MHVVSIALLAISGVPMTTTAGSGPPLTLTVVLGLNCLAIGLIVGVLVLGFFVTMRQRQAKDQQKEGKREND
jgi:hypothetical protein